MKNLTRISAGILSAILLGACASGPERRPPQGGQRGGDSNGFEGQVAKPIALLIVSMDVDQNGQTEGAELILGIEREWARLHTKNAVGALEYGTWAATTLGAEDALPSFISFDRDLNGRLSEVEFDDRLRAEFAELDKNSDGVVDRSELIFRVTRPSRGQGGQQGGQGGQGGRGGQDGRRPPR